MNDLLSLPTIDRAPQLKDRVYEHLRRAIVACEVAPGESLREAAVATQLGVSKTPVREALVRLAEEGLVELRTYRGAVASTYDRTTIVELFELRELVQVDLARRVAREAPEHVITALSANIAESRRARAVGDDVALGRLLSRFDDQFLALQANRLLAGINDRLRAHVERLGRLVASAPERLYRSVDEHAHIIDAVAARDEDAAAVAAREHILSLQRLAIGAFP
jgi:DNA-binding GntR family transcriptional regulator